MKRRNKPLHHLSRVIHNATMSIQFKVNQSIRMGQITKLFKSLFSLYYPVLKLSNLLQLYNFTVIRALFGWPCCIYKWRKEILVFRLQDVKNLLIIYQCSFSTIYIVYKKWVESELQLQNKIIAAQLHFLMVFWLGQQKWTYKANSLILKISPPPLIWWLYNWMPEKEWKNNFTSWPWRCRDMTNKL